MTEDKIILRSIGCRDITVRTGSGREECLATSKSFEFVCGRDGKIYTDPIERALAEARNALEDVQPIVASRWFMILSKIMVIKTTANAGRIRHAIDTINKALNQEGE